MLISLLQQLIQFKSITPDDCGALDFIADKLKKLNFNIIIKEFHGVKNLYAHYLNQDNINEEIVNICFAGHIDVVPPGDAKSWEYDPFQLTAVTSTIDSETKLYGRGVADMKAGLAAMITAAENFIIEQRSLEKKGNWCLSLLITANEEGDAIGGTNEMLQWLYENNFKIDLAILGEPSSYNVFGDQIKIGRRGSANFDLTVYGEQGHAAYPELAHNPIPDMMQILQKLLAFNFDLQPNQNLSLTAAKDFINKTDFQITSIDVGNPVTNIIPNFIKAKFNIRFNNTEHILKSVREIIDSCKVKHDLTFTVTAKPFISPITSYHTLLRDIVQKHTKILPKFSMNGGTSDGRFISNYCPVMEFGLISRTAHKINENILLKDFELLPNIYLDFLRAAFSLK